MAYARIDTKNVKAVGYQQGPAPAIRQKQRSAPVAGRGTPGYLTIYSPIDGLILQLLLDEDAPSLAGGWGGFDELAVPRGKPIRFWSAGSSQFLTAAVLLTDPGEQYPVLEEIGRPQSARHPRIVQLAGQLPPGTVRDWVIDAVEVSETEFDSDTGEATQMRLVITFGEPPTLEPVSVGAGGRSRRRRADGKAVSRVAPERLRQGESLQQFAARTLGSAARASEIATLNGIRDPRQLKAGRLLKLPGV